MLGQPDELLSCQPDADTVSWRLIGAVVCKSLHEVRLLAERGWRTVKFESGCVERASALLYWPPEQDGKALINTNKRAGERSKTVHRTFTGQTVLVTVCTQIKQNYKKQSKEESPHRSRSANKDALISRVVWFIFWWQRHKLQHYTPLWQQHECGSCLDFNLMWERNTLLCFIRKWNEALWVIQNMR